MFGRPASSIVAPLRAVDPFVYEPLDPLRDCTRVVDIEAGPTWNDAAVAANQDIRCHVRQVLFSDRPRYRALSYMWGDEAAKIPIYLNGKRFTVAENLFRALGFLRREKLGSFWIDAICINQDDIEEKNRQIRIMPHIYFRASSVLVWLGLYPKAQVVENAKKKGDPVRSFLTSKPALEDATFRLLGDCGYWKRLWVVQEVGKAASLDVCYATSQPDPKSPGLVQYRDCSLPWEEFIAKIQALDRPRDRTGALRLHDQLMRKDEGSHTLRSLLEAHHGALCKNPRDKVYGLAGLAEDCYGFPVDYANSLFEVWADTLRFLQHRGQIGDDADLPGLAGIMMNALGGPSQVMPPPGTSSSVVLELHLLLVGTMASIGPTPDEIINDLSVGDGWAARIHRNDKHAPRQNEKLIRNMLQMTNPNIPSVKVKALAAVGNDCEVWLPIERTKGDCAALLQKADETKTHGRESCAVGSSHICHLLTCAPPGRDRSWIGIVAGDFSEQDLLCSIPGSATTLLLRPGLHEIDEADDEGYTATVVGLVTGPDHRQAFGVEGMLSPRNSLSIHILADVLFKILYSAHSTPGNRIDIYSPTPEAPTAWRLEQF